ncbi:aminodeoxychorismate synthase component I [Williamsia sp. CHRR-6]|uniref:aminodeoxychorismate synthase component I n=1 Tax=Williamsia sp. CHRR-6 TaxID=2835871 RepID=UPI001BDB36A0|nr:aminodeoxychorismate synthase component I [Williamsia sp. CHRR-6]MBT0566647.1 aminodeoxychorismate synthase component I [Williamsia sp. CHRR-6]
MASGAIDLGPGPSAPELLGRLAERAARHGQPGPAALIGHWLGARAVLAPSIEVAPAPALPDTPDGWWLGYISYPDRLDEAALPPICGGVTDTILVLRERRWWLHRHGDAALADVPDWLPSLLSRRQITPVTHWEVSWTMPPPAPHTAAIEACLAAIRDGEVYQACVCTRILGALHGAAIDYYRSGLVTMSPRKSAFLQGDWGAVASFSPETYLRRRGDTVVSRPIKGTLPIDADPAELLTSVKDVAENVMIVDLVRNDLGRVAVPGSVAVPELLHTRPAPGVWHLVSTVVAEVPATLSAAALVEATFPPGSVTGTPKLRARELLINWETHARGVYCGAIGVVCPDGDLDLSVAIRTVEVTPDGTAAFGVGGGITIDSDPAREWQECLDKAATVMALRAP